MALKNDTKNKSKKVGRNIIITFISFFLIAGLFFITTNKKVFDLIASRISQFATVISSVLVLETNDFRATQNESSLTVSEILTKAAQMKADDMANKSYFSHTGPKGELPWVWFDKAGYKYKYAGENLAVDYTESSDVTEGWINSAKHKANLLNTNFTEIGIGVADGMFEGHKTTFVVQFFGKPLLPQETESVKNTISTKSIKLSDPADPVVTTSDLAKGEVLGVETNNNQNNNFAIGAVILIVLLILLKLFIKRKDSSYSRGK